MNNRSSEDKLARTDLALESGSPSLDAGGQESSLSLQELRSFDSAERPHRICDFPIYGLKNLPWQFLGVRDAA